MLLLKLEVISERCLLWSVRFQHAETCRGILKALIIISDTLTQTQRDGCHVYREREEGGGGDRGEGKREKGVRGEGIK